MFAGTARFEPVAVVGRGGMGVVYRVRDAETGTEVALKTLDAVSPDEVYRLKHEFRVLAGITHRNLVELHELFVDDDQCFFTMEYVDGVDFVAHVRGAGQTEAAADALDGAGLARLLDAARQLVAGLSAVHAAGKLHRDVKPSNVLVSAGGRVVLLDFGLARALQRGDRIDPESDGFCGSLAYAAPEQIWGGPPDPAADWYGVGVMLYEALAGRLPFDGPPGAVATAKARGAPALPPTIAARIPRQWSELVIALLDPDPARRPTGEDVARRLLVAPAAAPRAAARVLSADEPAPFVGRDAELARLRAQLDVVATGRTGVVRIGGPSGIGKSELVRRFLAGIEGDEQCLVLAGRCHPQESVPYKALDSVIDAVSRWLLTQPDAAVAALLPRRTGALARLFPVLARVPGVAAARRRREEADSVETRRRGFAALRDLIARIADTHRLVVWVDDLQWGDADSATLIGDLLHPPDPPPLLLLLSYRSEDAANIPLLRVLDEVARDPGGPAVDEVGLGPLPPADARELAERLCPADWRSPAQVAALAEESGGSPFFLAEVARYLGRGAPAGETGAGLDLAEVIRERVQELPPEARRIVELVAVAGAPIERSLVLQAARHGEAGRPLITRLEAHHLLRVTSVAERAGVEAYHDRIREAVVARLSAAELSDCHRDLAVAYESSGRAEPEVLARHFHGAGLQGKAADYAVAAADKAADALAFVRAAELYRLAREWDPRDAAWERVLLTREGEMLASAARFIDGARTFMTAATGAPRVEALDLRRRAAEQFIASGHLDDGVAVLSALLRELGLTYPRTPGRATLGAAVRAARLLLGGLAPGAGGPPADDEERIRIDTCYSTGKNLLDADASRGVYFSLEALARARRAGDPVRLARSLVIVGGTLCAVGGWLFGPLGARMMRLARATADEVQSPELLGTIAVASGQVHMLAGRWRKAVEECDAGVQLLVTRCRGVAFECNIGRASAHRALEELGEVEEAERRAREFLHAASTTGARYAEVAACQHLSMALLARDARTEARALARRAEELWTREGFHLQNLYAIRQQAYCDLYEGDVASAWKRVWTMWPALARSRLLRVPLVRIDAHSLRGRSALARACREPAAAPALLRTCTNDARRLAAERRPDADVHALLLRAGAAALAGPRAEAPGLLDRAIATAEQADMALHAAAARYRKGTVLGGREGVALMDDACRRLADGGVRAPHRWAALYAPGPGGGEAA